ncbi:MAG: T9SS type A sorting domain-containing protein [Bacteroidota bacterium]
MKKLSVLISTVLLVFSFSVLNAQTSLTGTDPGKVKPIGLSKNVYDSYGRKYTMEDLIIKKKGPGAPKVQETAGIFKLDFLDDPGEGFYNSTNGNDLRTVVKQVYSDLSAMIVETASPYTNIDNLGVNRWVEIEVRPALDNSLDPLLGQAGQYFPEWTPGIVHGTAWQTINSGIDFWTGINATNFGNFNFYHGFLEVNIGKPFYLGADPALIPSNQYDLYTVILHEAMHQLGFGTLINGIGNSYITGTNPGIYSYYDTYLVDQASGNHLVNWNSSYNASFNSAYQTDLTSACHVQFDGINNTFVTSPAAFNSASSLSHYPATDCGNAGTYLMRPGLNMGEAFRRPDVSEMTTLCDLGYQTTGSYAGFTYPSGACGTKVAGVNDYCVYDGTLPNTLLYTTPYDVNFSFASAGFLGNDHGTTWYDDLEVINGAGTIVSGATSGDNTNTIVFDPFPTFQGTAILRYVPRASQTGQRGNYTYIFIAVEPPAMAACNVPPCELVCYGDFEAFVTDPVNWQLQYDYYTHGSYSASNINAFVFENGGIDNSPDFRNFPSINFWGNCSASVQATGHSGISYIGMVLRTYGGGINSPEGPCFPLNAPIMPGESATVTLWGKLSQADCDGGFQVSFTDIHPCLNNTWLGSCPDLTHDITLAPLQLAHNTDWQPLTFNYTNTTAVAMNFIYINSFPFQNFDAAMSYIYLDDVSCIKNESPVTVTVTGPATACIGEEVQYTISICNNSGAAINNILVEDILPTGMTLAAGGTFTYPQTLIPFLANGDCEDFTLNAIVNTTYGTLTNQVQVIGGACNAAGSSTSSTLAVNNQHVSLFSTVSQEVACPGSIINYEVEMCNPMATAINGIQLQTTIPTGFTAIAGSGYTIAPPFVNWDPINLSGGTITNPACTTLILPVTVNAGSGTICSELVAGNAACPTAPSCAHTVYSDYCTTAVPSITIPNGANSTAYTDILPGTLVNIQGVFNINGANAYYNDVLFRMNPGSSIVVHPGYTLDIQGCYLYTCSGTWTGISVKGNGKIRTGKGTVIENAVTGVTAETPANPSEYADLQLMLTIFNRCSTGVQINPAMSNMQPASNQIIRNCIFTNRTFPCITPGLDLYTQLSNDLINESYTNWPVIASPTHCGIRVELNSLNNNTYSIGLPDAGSWSQNLNIFDNLAYGVISVSTNINVRNSLFQNLLGNSSNSSNPTGVGVFYSGMEKKTVTVGNAVSNLNSNTNEWNKFRNCLRGISIWSSSLVYSFNNVFTNSFTSSVFNTPGAYLQGEYAAFLQPVSSLTETTLRFDHNNVYNCATGIYIKRTSAFTRASLITIDCNTMSSGNLLNQYMNRGIYLVDPTTNTPSINIENYKIRYNNISNAKTNAISASNIKKGLYIFMNTHLSVLYFSSLNLISDIVKTVDVIRLANCSDATIMNNPVITTSNGNTNRSTEVLTGIYALNTTGLLLTNNVVTYVGTCIVFQGNCGESAIRSTVFTLNTMTQAKIGLYMYTGAIIGQQGSSSVTTGNKFGLAPTYLTSRMIYCNSGNNLNSLSKMYVKIGAPVSNLIQHPDPLYVYIAPGTTGYNICTDPVTCGIVPITAPNCTVFSCIVCNCNAYGTLPSMLAQPAVVSENTEDNSWEEKSLTDDSDMGFENTVKVYPNPNSGSFKLQYNVREEGTLNFQLCDYSGKVIVNNMLKAGEKIVDINIGDYPGGLYFYRLLSSGGEMIASGKVSVLR